MITLKTITRCAPFFGLVAVALSGCWDESAGPAGPEDTLCEKLAECGELSEGVTTDRCAANARLVHEQTGKELEVCKPVFEKLQSLMVCTAKQGGCESAVGMEAAALPAFTPTNETSECVIVKEAIDLAFSLHTRVLRDFFARARQ